MKVHEIKLRFVKSFLIEGKEDILVDAGTPGSGKMIISKLKEMGKDPNKISYVIFTHSHIDHIGGASELGEKEFFIYRNGLTYLREGKVRKPQVHSPLLSILFKVASPFLMKPFKGVEGKEIKEGEFFPGVEIIYTPGHTDDSISIYLPEINSIIVGDTLMGGLKSPSIYENYEELQKSIEKIKELKPKSIYVSHGKSVT
ncbi:MBL fold metallo-hydrolase [Acidianus sp. HS-5]|uniref:MBL fold metallo-hydrolase n=1 Tax=Acidianus sp. HS-5 TaxID=2886040 RepID=UPI001F3944AE|nr:MBL fold metallo-hydrolase [Acidianus sp. HS-5]BDC17468.1 MBL fold metallo-hydrolase [Acidianus sp. HS-5]